jgi:hypothetical protein
LGLPAFAHSWQVLEDLPVQEEVIKEVTTASAEVLLQLETVESSRQV